MGELFLKELTRELLWVYERLEEAATRDRRTCLAYLKTRNPNDLENYFKAAIQHRKLLERKNALTKYTHMRRPA